MTRGTWRVDWVGRKDDEVQMKPQIDYFDKHDDDAANEADARKFAEEVGAQLVWFQSVSDGPWKGVVA